MTKARKVMREGGREGGRERRLLTSLCLYDSWQALGREDVVLRQDEDVLDTWFR